MYRYYNVQDLTAWQALLLGEQKKYLNFCYIIGYDKILFYYFQRHGNR